MAIILLKQLLYFKPMAYNIKVMPKEHTAQLAFQSHFPLYKLCILLTCFDKQLNSPLYLATFIMFCNTRIKSCHFLVLVYVK